MKGSVLHETECCVTSVCFGSDLALLILGNMQELC